MKKRFSNPLQTLSQICLASCVLAGSLLAATVQAQSETLAAGTPLESAVVAPPAVAPAYGVQASVPAPSIDPRTQALLMERERVSAQRIGIGGPLSMLGVGIALTVVGWGPLYATSDYCANDGYGRSCGWNPRMTAGAIVGVSGLALATAGAAFLTVRIVRRVRRARELERIDSDLRTLNMRASVAPWLGVSHGSPIGLSGKLTF